MAAGRGLVGVAVRAGPEVGVSVNVEVGCGVAVAVGDDRTVGVLIKVGVSVGKTSPGSARTAPVKRRDMTTMEMASPMKMYLISEGIVMSGV